MPSRPHFINREISWLAFNERVLQEASDPVVPLLQRMRFLGIFSNNLDEFFRVRVATMKRMVLYEKDKLLPDGKSPEQVLFEIQKTVVRQQVKHQLIYQDLLAELRKHKIFVINETQVSKEHGKFIDKYYQDTISLAVVPIMLHTDKPFPYLKDDYMYFSIKLSYAKEPHRKPQYALIEVAPGILPRFTVLPSKDKSQYIMILDDIIRFNLPNIFANFDFDTFEAYNIKITRDAELDMDDDISTSFIEKMSQSLKRRKKGAAVRFVYDAAIPSDLLTFIMRKLKLDDDDNLIAGARYHNFKDFIGFPSLGPKNLEKKPYPPLYHKHFPRHGSLLKVIKERDVILHYPYHTFSHFIDLLREAAIDPNVREIKITLYRVAKESKVINALVNAAKNGKRVTVVIELRARFDEQANIKWSSRLEEEGIKIIFGVAGLKVHSKIALIRRREDGQDFHYAYVGTGNFHESTSKLYADEGLFTSDPRITSEVSMVFDFIETNYKLPRLENLLLSPFSMRSGMYALLDQEIEHARAGRKALLVAKLNSLVDEGIVDKLYEASQAGVVIRLIVRGACSLVPGIPGLSENIQAISIVDKFLEHSRVIYFHNNGDRKIFIASADWMTRNLDKRVEVAAPILDKAIQQELIRMLDLQWKDNTKARMHDQELSNAYRRDESPTKVRAQIDFYDYLKKKMEKIDAKEAEQ